MKKYISLGMGVQSTALYYMCSLSELPAVDGAIFADLGGEKADTLKYLDFLQNWAVKYSKIPIHVIKMKNLFKDLISQKNSSGRRFASIPAFVDTGEGVGMLRRQCTGEYKIRQIDNLVRELSGRPKNKRLEATEIWKGISFDEIERMSIPDRKWKTHVYPFCNYKFDWKNNYERLEYPLMRRTDIVSWYKNHSLPLPVKSSCFFCPYQSEVAWRDMKQDHPDDFENACQVDEGIRNMLSTRSGNPAYLHDSCKPLREVQFGNSPDDMWKGECSGNCHI